MSDHPSILAFDIETIPDLNGVRQLDNMPADVSDEEVLEMAKRRLRQERNHEFFPLHLQRVVTISCILRRFSPQLPPSEQFKVFSLPLENAPTDEAQAVQLFYQCIEKHEPILVSWNGSGFDLPVLNYRAMINRIQTRNGFWRTDGDYRWNTYTNRFHEHHTDLMDVLSLYQGRGYASLNDISILCGLPGKIGIGGAKVWSSWQKGELQAIRRYCEHDTLLTYLLYARFQHLRGMLNGDEEFAFVRRQLQQEPARWDEFLSGWKDGGEPHATLL